MKSAIFVVAMLLGTSSANTVKNILMTDEELSELDLSFYSDADLEDLRITEAKQALAPMENQGEINKKYTVAQKIKCAEIKQDQLTNTVHMRHRMDVWDDKLDKLDEMKVLIANNEDVADAELVEMVNESEKNLRRVMKYDVESFLARQDNLSEDFEESCQSQVEAVAEVAEAKVEEQVQQPVQQVSAMTSLYQTAEKYEKKADEFMDKLREDYRDISFIECIVYANLIVFSLAATVAYLFYQSPGSMKTATKKRDLQSLMINTAANFENVKVPKKEIKKQFKKIQKDENNNKECML